MLETCIYKPTYWNNSSLWTRNVSSLKSSHVSCISSSLQEDLEMSDSDDEITDVKNTETKINLDVPAVEYPCAKSSPINNSVTPINSSTADINKMDVPQSVPSNSSSSESGDSDSDDSSSESNDSDSSASSDASDADTPSKMWGLSNFFDDPRRNHSPAFVPMDTSTNSSTAAVKEDHIAVPQDSRANYSLVDDDSVNANLRDPATDPIPNFIELENPLTIKNEILSPIPSPIHPSGPSAPLLPPPLAPPPQTIRGPRTPPTPSFPVADESVDTNRNSVSTNNVQTENSPPAEQTVQQSQTIKHSSVQQNSCDMREAGKVQATTVKKRLSKKLSEIFSPRTDSSPVTQSFEDDEPSASKGLPDVSLDKDENDMITVNCSYSVPSEPSESSHDNYSIKTRQKISKSSSAKKSKIPSGESLNESGQKGNNSSKSIGPKIKHPTRTHRASTDTKQLSKTVKTSTKSDKSEEGKKTPVKSETKDKSSSEKNKNSLKTSENLKSVSKNSLKIKKKPQKMTPKQVTEGKKNDVKRKKSKFHIENFLQSPTVSQNESVLIPKASSVHSPSRDRSPIPEHKTSLDSKRRPSISPSCASRSPSRSSSKSVERAKGSEKLRRSTRCSERASSVAQAESSAVANQDSDVAKKSAKRTPKRRERTDMSPVNVEATPLSPIPHFSPIPMTVSECAIPTKIIVSIPLDKITRLPAAVRSLDPENKLASKRSQQTVDESSQMKESVLLEKSSKNAPNKRAVSKDIKDKLRTDPNSKSKGNKCALVSKKDKNVKALYEPSASVKSKPSSSVNNKTSIKTPDRKSSWDASENKVSRKRKSEDSKQPQKKKIKTYPEPHQDRTQHTSSRIESPSNLSTSTTKSKGLERCDSVSSLSSLGSQMSQRSSKEKRSSPAVSDNKKGKSPRLNVKHIKQEKEDKVITIKQEPGTPEKCKEKSKVLSKDANCSEKNVLDPLWNDTSSQFSIWGDPCKEDSKGPISMTAPLIDSITRVCGLDWECLDIKDLKEASNLKHNNNPPIMPMDYYYTEGRKQRHLAEREKDPFLQTLKYFEATVLFILTSQQREEYTKEPESVYQFYRETLNFSNLILQNVRIQQSSPGSTEFKLLILILRCQALLHVKLYNLKIKEIKEQQKSVSEFFLSHCPATVRGLTHPPSNPRMSHMSIPSPHSPTPSPASSVNSQTSGYSSSDVSSCHRNLPPFSPSVNVTQNMLEIICRQHTHLINLHMGHDLWEQADMYMTRSNLREFFKEVADQSENLTLHSSIKDLVNYVQTGISLVKKCSR